MDSIRRSVTVGAVCVWEGPRILSTPVDRRPGKAFVILHLAQSIGIHNCTIFLSHKNAKGAPGSGWEPGHPPSLCSFPRRPAAISSTRFDVNELPIVNPSYPPCPTQDAFKKLWDVDNTTKGRALIIPEANVITGVDLSWGATPWAAILDGLLAGKSVGDAVKNGNAAGTTKNSQYTWQIIGDPNVRLAKPPK